MDYLVIARKYRPQVFEDVLGQDHITRTLKNAIESNRIAHAYLFSGPRGVGKTTVARILAKCLNCVNGPTSTPCNECENCKALNDGSSVDVFEIDGASNTGVDNVRDLRESVKFMPQSGKFRVYIIDEVHMLSTAAFNALLKTLEEPPPHVKFIFATTEAHKIPATINSRCQRFDFKRVALQKLSDYLTEILEKEGFSISPEALFPIIRESEGSVRDAQSLLDQVIAYSSGDGKKEITSDDVTNALGLMDRGLIFDLSRAVIEKDNKEILNIVERIFDFGFDLKTVAKELVEHIRDLNICKVLGGDAKFDMPDSEVQKLKELSELTSIDKLDMVFSIFTKGVDDVARSATPRYSMEMMLLRAARSEDFKSIEALIDKARELGIGSGSGNNGGSGHAPGAASGSGGGASSGRGGRLPWQTEGSGNTVKKNSNEPLVEPPVAKSPVAKPPVATPPVATPPVVTPPVIKPDTAKAAPPVAISTETKSVVKEPSSQYGKEEAVQPSTSEPISEPTPAQAPTPTPAPTIDGFRDLMVSKMSRLVQDINNFQITIDRDNSKKLNIKGPKNQMIEGRLKDLMGEYFGRSFKLDYEGLEVEVQVKAKAVEPVIDRGEEPSQSKPKDLSATDPQTHEETKEPTEVKADAKDDAKALNKNDKAPIDNNNSMGHALKIFSEGRVIEDTRRK